MSAFAVAAVEVVQMVSGDYSRITLLFVAHFAEEGVLDRVNYLPFHRSAIHVDMVVINERIFMC